MLQRIAAFFKKNYFGESLPFEYRIYMIFFLEALAMSLISFTANVLLGAGLLGIVVEGIYNISCIIILFISVEARMKIFKPLLIFMAFFYVPFLFFPTAGYNGTSMFFAIVAAFMLCIIFKGKLRIGLIAANIAEYFCLALLEYNFPYLVTPFVGETAQLMDLLVATTLCFTGMAILATYVSKAYEGNVARVESLVQVLEGHNKKLEELTNKDTLTGVYNRRFIMDFLTKELETCAATGHHICLLMMDLDWFKKINDTYGHGFGDEVLISFADTVQNNLRKNDVLARYGGEEFLVVLHNPKLENALTTAERIRGAISSLEFHADIKISASIGLVQSRPEESVDDLIHRADVCMYSAKEKGRDQVVWE